MKVVPQFTPLNIDGFRSFLQPELSGMPAEDLEQIVNTPISEMSPGAAEDFMKAIGSTLQRGAPGMVKGATTGASMGGPWGALIGAGAGLASSALSKQGKPASAGAPAPGVTAPPPASGVPEITATPSLPNGQAAAATLLGILQNPTVQQALMSQVLGASGKQQVPAASGASLPRGAINGLLMQLLANATEGLVESESTFEQEYLQDESGEYLIDPASPEQQAAAVLSHLQADATEFQESNFGDFTDTVEWMEDLGGSESEDWPSSDSSAEMVQFY